MTHQQVFGPRKLIHYGRTSLIWPRMGVPPPRGPVLFFQTIRSENRVDITWLVSTYNAPVWYNQTVLSIEFNAIYSGVIVIMLL